MIYQTTSSGIRILKTSIFLKKIEDFISVDEKLESPGFEVLKEYSYSLDGQIYYDVVSSFNDLFIDILNNPVFIGLENFFIHLRFKYTVTKSKEFIDDSRFELVYLKANDQELGKFEIEIGQMLEQTIMRTSSNRTLNPYKYNDNAKTLYRELSIGINEMFGFDVIYFRTESLEEHKSITFKLYDLNNVVDTKRIKLSIKNNDIPENLEHFSEYGYDFQNELVIHIIKHDFEKVFGIGEKPNSNDFIYFPLTDKMYQLNAPYDPKSFMQYCPFWEIMTTKYEKRSSVKGQNDKFHKVDEMIEFTDDFFKLDERFELDDATKKYNKPDQLSAIDEKHIVSSEEPISKELAIVYSISTMKASPNELVHSYDFYQDYDNKILMTSWFKVSSDTGVVFRLSGDNPLEFIRCIQIPNGLALSIEQLNNSNIINLPIPKKDKFFGFVMMIDEESFELSCLIINTKKEIISQGTVSMMKFAKHLTKVDIYGRIKYSMLRLCKNTTKYSYEDLLINDILPEVKDFVVMKNATPTLTHNV